MAREREQRGQGQGQTQGQAQARMPGAGQGAGSGPRDGPPPGPSGAGGSVGAAMADPPPPEPIREQTQPELLRKVLRDQQARLAEVLPRVINVERWIGVVLAVNHRDGALRQCSAASVFTAAMQGAMLGLDFSPSLGQAYLIPRRRKDGRGFEATFMIGYKGLRKLALNSGEYRWIESRLVYASESSGTIGEFRYGYSSDRDGDDLEYTHTPNPDPATRGEITHAYAVGMRHDGHRTIEVMTVDEINKEARSRSESYNSGSGLSPWRTHYGMQCRKTALKRFCGQSEMSPELADAIDRDNEDYQQTGKDDRNERHNRGSAALARRLGIAPDQPQTWPGDGPGDGRELTYDSDDGGSPVEGWDQFAEAAAAGQAAGTAATTEDRGRDEPGNARHTGGEVAAGPVAGSVAVAGHGPGAD